MLALAGGFLLASLANQSLVLAASALVLTVCIALMLRWPETGTLVVLFALYSNVGVLAMRSPKAIQAAAGDPHQNPRIAVVLAILFFLLLVPLLYRIFIYREKAIFDRGFVLMLLFTVPLLLSSLFARDTNIALSELADYFVEGLALYLLISNSLRDSATLRKAIWALLLAGSLMGGLSLLQKATHTQRSIYGGLAQVESDFQSNPRMPQVAARAEAANRVADNGEVEGQVRSAGPIGETNRYGQILLVLLPLAALQFGTEKSRRMRNIAILAGALILGGLLLTLSRGTLLAALIAFALMGFMRLLPARQILKALLAITVFVLIFQPGVISRMATLERLEGLVSSSHRTQAPDSSAVRRYVENLAAWRVFLDHPLLGVGPGHFAAYYSNDYGNRVGLVEQTKGYRAHNLYLEILAETGIVGFTSFIAIPGVVIYSLWKERRRLAEKSPQYARLATAFLIALCADAASAIFAHLSYQRYLWLLLAFAAAAVRICRAECVDNRTNPPLFPATEDQSLCSV